MERSVLRQIISKSSDTIAARSSFPVEENMRLNAISRIRLIHSSSSELRSDGFHSASTHSHAATQSDSNSGRLRISTKDSESVVISPSTESNAPDSRSLRAFRGFIFLPNVQSQAWPSLAPSVRLGAQNVTAKVIVCSALLGSFVILRCNDIYPAFRLHNYITNCRPED